jgi:hypothetical protein
MEGRRLLFLYVLVTKNRVEVTLKEMGEDGNKFVP